MDGVTMSELHEKIAAALHDYWVKIKEEMFMVALEIPKAGILIIDTDSMEEWAKRADSTYANLTEKEKATYLAAANAFVGFVSMPVSETRLGKVKSYYTFWNLRDKEGNDIGDLHPGATLEIIGEDADRYRVAGWAYKRGFEDN